MLFASHCLWKFELTATPARQLDELLPTKAAVNITRLSNRSSVYTVAADVGAPPNPPLFFEVDYGGIYPTVYCLWRFPELVAVRIATFSEVSPKASYFARLGERRCMQFSALLVWLCCYAQDAHPPLRAASAPLLLQRNGQLSRNSIDHHQTPKTGL